MPRHNELFNIKLACSHISTKHIIGILKGRFPLLKNIRMLVTDKKEHMLRILRLLDCCGIINILMLDMEVTPNPMHLCGCGKTEIYMMSTKKKTTSPKYNLVQRKIHVTYNYRRIWIIMNVVYNKDNFSDFLLDRVLRARSIKLWCREFGDFRKCTIISS